MQKRYVAGFLFTEHHVLLVQKKSPEWQKGLWNGVGGKVEDIDESTLAAMVREFEEEVQVPGLGLRWREVAVEEGRDYVTAFYASRIESMMPITVLAENDAGEPLAWRETRFLDQLRVIGNLRWLIPLALDWRQPIAQVYAMKANITERATW